MFIRAVFNRALRLLGLSLVSIGMAHAATDLKTLEVDLVEVTQLQELDGVVEAVRQATVNAQINARVTEVNFDVDDFVEEGALLLRFRDVEAGSAVSAAQAQVAEARARLTEAQADLNRIADLHERRLIAQAQLDNARANRDSARARLRAAEAQLVQAREQVENTEIRAPFSGYVTERFVEPGEAVTAGSPLLSGVSLDELRVAVQVPQRMVQAVRDAGEATVVMPGGGRVGSERLTIFPYADERSHAFTARVYLPREDSERLYPGTYLKVEVPLGSERQMLVPISAVVRRSELTGLYVLGEAGDVHLRQVRLGERRGDRVNVLAGLEPGERVALDPVAAGVMLKRALESGSESAQAGADAQ
ncbi:MAG: efflux RND transporter periplasmic adaptor subunit [Halothiobacillaceae bacterium]